MAEKEDNWIKCNAGKWTPWLCVVGLGFPHSEFDGCNTLFKKSWDKGMFTTLSVYLIQVSFISCKVCLKRMLLNNDDCVMCVGRHHYWNPLVTHHKLWPQRCTVPPRHNPQVERWARFLRLWPHSLLRPSPGSTGGRWDRWRPRPAWGLVPWPGLGQARGHCAALWDQR